MASKGKGVSPSDTSGGDAGRDLYEELTDDLLYDPAVGRATMMGYPCVRLAGRFLASYDDKEGCLVVKLPRERVQEVIEAGDGGPSRRRARSSANGSRSPRPTASFGADFSPMPPPSLATASTNSSGTARRAVVPSDRCS
jgi:hypothetical protein